MIIRLLLFLSIIFTLTNLNSNCKKDFISEKEFHLGDDMLIRNIHPIKDVRVALVTNQTGILSNGTHLADTLVSLGINITKIFSPEHGIRGDEVYKEYDEKTGIRIISLYGSKLKPTPSDLENVDVLIYDIQDVGTRFYTYTTTLYYVLTSAIENNKQLIVCDRPIIINPDYVDGFMLEPAYISFVGTIPTPVCYGFTCGELALFLKSKINSDYEKLIISQMSDYSRSTDFETLNLKWVKPSPNMFTPQTALVYPSTCFLEGTNVSEGRGTDKPFEYFGAPWCDGKLLAEQLNSYSIEGVEFSPIVFTPSEKISQYPPKFFGEECNGVYIKVTNKILFQPVKTGVAILICLNKLFKEFKFQKNNFIDKLAGTDKLRKMILNGDDLMEIVRSWDAQLKKFISERKKYLLYQ